MAIQAFFEEPTDYTKTDSTQWQAQTVVTINVAATIPDCDSSTFDAFPLEDMRGSVHNTAKYFQLEPA